jgi:RNA polymerase sigma factor (sigma-70 family)
VTSDARQSEDPCRDWSDALLREAGWIRRLAQRLLGGDDGGAEDVTQDVLAAALERRPQLTGHELGLRAWLAKVTRHRASRIRTQALRRRAVPIAEVDAPLGRADDEPPEAVARLEFHKRLVDEVLALPEPYRGVVVARFFEGLDVEEIARRRGASDAAIRKQISRAVGRLRDRLERSGLGAERGGWRAALVWFVGGDVGSWSVAGSATGKGVAVAAKPGVAAAGVTGALTVGVWSMKAKVAAVVACVLLFAWFFPFEPSTPRPPAEPAGDPGRLVAEGVAGPRDSGGANAATSPERGEVTVQGPRTCEVRVVNEARFGRAGMQVVLIPGTGPIDGGRIAYGTTDADGRVRLTVEEPNVGKTEPWRLLLARPGRLPVLRGFALPARGATAEVVLEEGAVIEGVVRVSPEWSETIPATDPRLPRQLTLRAVGSTAFDIELPAAVREWIGLFGLHGVETAFATVDRRDGSFRFEGLMIGGEAQIELPEGETLFFFDFPRMPAGARERSVVVSSGSRGIVLDVVPVAGVRGRVVFDDGEPASGSSGVSVQPWFDREVYGGGILGARVRPDGGFAAGLGGYFDPHRWMDPAEQPRITKVKLWVTHPDAVEREALEFDLDPGVRVADVGVIVLQRLDRVHVQALDPEGRPVLGVYFESDGHRSEPTRQDGRTTVPVADREHVESLRIGGAGWLIDDYRAVGGVGTEADPLRFERREENRLILRLTSGAFRPEHVDLVVLGADDLFHGARPREQALGSRLHAIGSGHGSFVFRSAGARSDAGGRLVRRAHGFSDEGEFVLSSLMPGREFELLLVDGRGRTLLEQVVGTPDLGGLAEVALAIDEPACDVVVGVVPSSGGSAEGASVMISGGPALFGSRPVEYLRPGEDERYSATLLATGETVDLRVVAQNHVTAYHPIRLTAGTVEATVVLEPAIDLVARFVTTSGRLVDSLVGTSLGDDAPTSREPDGSTRIERLPSRPVELFAWHAGREFRHVVEDPRRVDGRVEVVVPEPETVAIRVAPSVDRNSVIQLRAGVDGHGWDLVSIRFVDGSWQPSSVPLYPGRYHVRCTRDGDHSTLERSIWVVTENDSEPRWLFR